MTELQKVIYEVLSASSTPLQRQQIFAAFKAKAPHLADDSVIPCPYCKGNHPLWKHKAALALQYLKNKKLAHSPKRGFWESTVKPEPEPPEPLHQSLKRKIKEIGEVLGRYARVEYPAPPYAYDVVWKEVEGLPRPCHVFEVQDKGEVDKALAKLQHARDIWKPKLFLVVTGEKDRKKVETLLKPYLEGSFHGISKHTTVLTAEVIDEIHKALRGHSETIGEFLEV